MPSEPQTIEQRLPIFGEAVRVRGRLSRSYRDGRKEWVDLPALPIRVALVIGIRTLSNGRLHFWGEDGGTEYRPDKHFKAVLVVEDIKSAPYYVLPENVLPLIEAAAA